jgi:hypothetical protein
MGPKGKPIKRVLDDKEGLLEDEPKKRKKEEKE